MNIRINIQEFYDMFKHSGNFKRTKDQLITVYNCYKIYRDEGKCNLFGKLLQVIEEAECHKKKLRLLQEALDL